MVRAILQYVTYMVFCGMGLADPQGSKESGRSILQSVTFIEWALQNLRVFQRYARAIPQSVNYVMFRGMGHKQ